MLYTVYITFFIFRIFFVNIGKKVTYTVEIYGRKKKFNFLLRFLYLHTYYILGII